MPSARRRTARDVCPERLGDLLRRLQRHVHRARLDPADIGLVGVDPQRKLLLRDAQCGTTRPNRQTKSPLDVHGDNGAASVQNIPCILIHILLLYLDVRDSP